MTIEKFIYKIFKAVTTKDDQALYSLLRSRENLGFDFSPTTTFDCIQNINENVQGTIMHCAVLRGSSYAVEQLIKVGASTIIPCSKGKLAVEYAMEAITDTKNKKKQAEYQAKISSIEKGGFKHSKKQDEYSFQQSKNERLHKAIECRSSPMIVQLLKEGAQINAFVDGLSAIDKAAECKYWEVAEVFLDYNMKNGVKSNINNLFMPDLEREMKAIVRKKRNDEKQSENFVDPDKAHLNKSSGSSTEKSKTTEPSSRHHERKHDRRSSSQSPRDSGPSKEKKATRSSSHHGKRKNDRSSSKPPLTSYYIPTTNKTRESFFPSRHDERKENRGRSRPPGASYFAPAYQETRESFFPSRHDERKENRGRSRPPGASYFTSTDNFYTGQSYGVSPERGRSVSITVKNGCANGVRVRLYERTACYIR